MKENSAGILWIYNSNLLNQAIEMIVRLKSEADSSFNYAQAVGPHVRHIIEHYTALLDALVSTDGVVDYDARTRDQRIQSIPDVTLDKLYKLRNEMLELANTVGDHSNLNEELRTRLKVGVLGEQTVTLVTTLGRELTFLSSHTVHHFATVSLYCKKAGVDLGHDFGKAPATVAHELQAA